MISFLRLRDPIELVVAPTLRFIRILTFDLDTGFDADRGDLLDDLRGAVEVDETLVDLHLEHVPGLGAVTARGLAGGDAEGLGGHADGSLDLERLFLGAVNEVRADCVWCAEVNELFLSDSFPF